MIRKSIASAALAALVISLAIPAGPAKAGGNWYWSCDTQPVSSFWEADVGGNELSGRGTVCATSAGLWSTLRIRGLTPGNAYTVWWVYIDDPASCVNFPLTPATAPIPFDEPVGYAEPCGLADFFTPDASGAFLNPLAVFGRMDSVIAGHRRTTRFAGDLRGLEPSPGSQVWLFAFGHGPAATTDKRQLARQLLTPEDPGSGIPHVGIEGRPFGYPAAVSVFRMP